MSDEQRLPYQPGEEMQPSGTTSTALVNQVQELLAGMEVRLIKRMDEQQVLTAEVVDRIIDHKLQLMSDSFHRTLARYQDDMRAELKRQEARFDKAFEEIDSTNARLDLLFPPTVERWLSIRLRSWAYRIIAILILVNLTLFFFDRYLAGGV